MEVRFVTGSAVEDHAAEALPALRTRTDGFLWVDVPTWSPEAERALLEVFGAHPMAVRACAERNHVATVHGYDDHVFVVLLGPLPGEAGHVHLVELDLFLGERFLVTVHGPLNPVVPVDAALAGTRAALRRLETHRLVARTPAGVAYAAVGSIVRDQRAMVDGIARRIAELEQRVMSSGLRDPEQLLEEMFLVRHELLAVRTMAVQEHEVLARAAGLPRGLDPAGRELLRDLAEQLERVSRVYDGEKDFLFGVIDLYQTRATTKMTVAMERLAVLAAITLPITAIASVYGMNVIVNERTHAGQLVAVIAVMATISALLLRWTKRQGWW